MRKALLLILGILILLLLFIKLRPMLETPPDHSSAKPHLRPASMKLLNEGKPLSQLIPAFDKSKVSLLIEKSRYRLTVYYNAEPIKSYPVVFGGDPVNDKLREGDLCTPEGHFQIKDAYPHRSWSKFLWLDYPTADSWRKYTQAKLQAKIPTDAGIGSEIGIHGVEPNDDWLIEKRRNWTAGCISLTRKDIDELYGIVQKGTDVEIVR